MSTFRGRARTTSAIVVGAVAMLGFVGCGPQAAGTPATTPPTATDDPSPPAEDPRSTCGTAGLEFDAHPFVPHDAPAVATIRLDSSGLTETLRRLSEFSRGEGHGLPIPLSFSLGQWSWQVPLLQSTLADAGFEPGELLFVAGIASDNVWVWRSDCDLDEAIERIEQAWGVEARRVVEGVVASPVAPKDPDAAAFPYEVVMLSAERIALIPVGQAQAFLRRWSQRPPPAPAGGASTTPGARLDTVPAATIRLVVSNEGLLDPTVQAGSHDAQAWAIEPDRLDPVDVE